MAMYKKPSGVELEVHADSEEAAKALGWVKKRGPKKAAKKKAD